jgi:hypothetical protein
MVAPVLLGFRLLVGRVGAGVVAMTPREICDEEFEQEAGEAARVLLVAGLSLVFGGSVVIAVCLWLAVRMAVGA